MGTNAKSNLHRETLKAAPAGHLAKVVPADGGLGVLARQWPPGSPGFPRRTV